MSYQHQIHYFQFCEKKSDSFCHFVPNQSLGTTSISHPGGAMSWQQQFTSLRTRKSTQNRCSLTRTCTAQATATTRTMLTRSCQTQQQVTGKKAMTESWRSKANKSTDENCSHAVPRAEIYGKDKVAKCLESKEKIKAAPHPTLIWDVFCKGISKILTQTALMENRQKPPKHIDKLQTLTCCC